MYVKIEITVAEFDQYKTIKADGKLSLWLPGNDIPDTLIPVTASMVIQAVAEYNKKLQLRAEGKPVNEDE